MQLEPRIGVDSSNDRFPFIEFFKSNDQMTLRAMRKVADEMTTALKNDLYPGHASNAATSRRRRSPRMQERTGAYFANTVYSKVGDPVRKVPVFWITSAGKNSLAYEASHGNMARILQQFSGREGI